MCLSPISIKNPRCVDHSGPRYAITKNLLNAKSGFFNKSASLAVNRFAHLYNTSDPFILVPCGKCPACLSRKQTDFVQRSIMECYSSFNFFITLTYNDSHLPVLELPDVLTGEVYKFVYPDFSHVQKMFKRFRIALDKNDSKLSTLRGRTFRYFVASEYGSKKHRPHFHIILSVHSLPSDYTSERSLLAVKMEKQLFAWFFNNWAVNVGSDKFPVYESLFTYFYNAHNKQRNFDLHYMTDTIEDVSSKSKDSVSFYASKYMMKFDSWSESRHKFILSHFPLDVAKKIIHIIRPKHTFSHGYGFGSDIDSNKHIIYQNAVRHLDKKYFCFVNPYSGKTFPLCRYYKNRCLDVTIYERLYSVCTGFKYSYEEDVRNIEVDRSFIGSMFAVPQSSYPSISRDPDVLDSDKFIRKSRLASLRNSDIVDFSSKSIDDFNYSSYNCDNYDFSLIEHHSTDECFDNLFKRVDLPNSDIPCPF
ncbi:replication initiator protein [Capybara microvirus Cap1_SP_51]|nr:replication initiator protein [Capybara microvirus Cap1_SP_51]